MSIEVTDRYGRGLSTLRITVTHRCNYSCFFCHMEGEASGDPELTPAEIGIIAEAFSRLGVRNFKITGGEPLVRRDIIDIIREIKERASAEDISMTTNGSLLEEMAERLREAGLDRLNISIHSLRRERYRYITGRDLLEKVLRGLEKVKRLGFRQIKINVVVLRGVNDDEIPDYIELIRGRDDMVLQLIELHPVGSGAGVFRDMFLSLDIVEKKILEMADSLRIRREMHNRPLYHLREGGYIELVKPVSNPIFCAGCRRLRLTVDGKIKTCIMRNDTLVDLMPVIRREDLSREEKISRVVELVLRANELREPYFKWRIDPGLDRIVERYRISEGIMSGRVRISIPKRYTGRAT